MLVQVSCLRGMLRVMEVSVRGRLPVIFIFQGISLVLTAVNVKERPSDRDLLLLHCNVLFSLFFPPCLVAGMWLLSDVASKYIPFLDSGYQNTVRTRAPLILELSCLHHLYVA